jgi:hypothetical protein
MSQQWNDSEDDDLDENERELGGRARGAPLRMRQLRLESQIQSADAQKNMARATAKSARYMLMAAIASTVSAVVTVIGVIYGVYVVVSHTPH